MDTDEKRYPLSVIVPIHRSDVDVRRCLLSLLKNPSLDLQIIVAANSDRKSELQRINRLIPYLPCITLLNIPKAGKANAINEALQYVENKYVLICDADTLFIQNGINRCLEKLYSDESIVAITGAVDPIKENKLSAIQKFEYRRIFRIFRPFWNLFHANLIVSGCAGIFKTETLFTIGLYDCHTLGEDFEITLRLHDYHIRHKMPYKIEYVDAPVAKTDVPKTLKALIRQRGRWFAGLIDVMWKYRKILLHPLQYRTIFIPYIVTMLFEVVGTFSKWILYGISMWLSFIAETSLPGILLITGACFILFESLFNICFDKRLKMKRLSLIFGMTISLAAIQFLLKDTNLFCGIKMMKQNENRWK